jgi:20S proteasome alpha/beta subunit
MKGIVFALNAFVLHDVLVMKRMARKGRTRFGCFVDAASSRSNYNPYQYDLTVPQFTPDGRLLQVEYAKMASTDHSIPIVAATIRHDHDSNSDEPQSPETLTVLIAGRRKAEGQQSRLILLPSFSSIISSSSHHTSTGSGEKNCIVISISGVLADALSILQNIQSFRIQEYRTMGSTATDLPATRRIATQIASQCQARTLAGGKRPLGAMFWITTPSNQETNGFVLYQTDPSGAMHEIILNNASNSVAILGGGDCGAVIRKRLESEWIRRPADETLPADHKALKRRIGCLLNVVVEEYRKHYFSLNDKGFDETDVDKTRKIDCDLDRLEVVILSSTRGAIHLTHDQVRSLLQEQ